MSNRSRSALAFCVLGAVGSHADAGSLVDVRAVSARTTLSAQSVADLQVHCPPGALALSGVATPSQPESVQVLRRWGLIGSTPAPIVDGVYSAATGINFTVQSTASVSVTADVQILCSPLSGSPSPAAASTVVANYTLQGKERRRVTVTCPSGQVALGGGYEALGGPVVSDYPALPFYFGGGYQVPDGNHPAPIGWEVDTINFLSAPHAVRVAAFCYGVPNISTVVGSATLQPGQYAFRGLAIDDTLRILGSGAAGGTEGYVRGGARWTPRFGVNFSRDPETIPVGGGGFAGAFVRNLDTAMPTDVKVGLIVEPFTGAPPVEQIVDVVEYKHTPSNFYFSTAIGGEIADLDAGIHLGWQRTGESYKAWAAGSGGPVGRQPVFRYHAPSLVSHFYTGSVLEGHIVRWGFGGAWQIEAGEVFQFRLPDPLTGACPPDTDQIFRTYNPRGNHRLTTNRAARDFSIDHESHVAEGFGPLGVVGCAPKFSFASK